MSNTVYHTRYTHLLKRLKRSGLIHAAKCWWYLPDQWSHYRRAQLKAMRQALKRLTA